MVKKLNIEEMKNIATYIVMAFTALSIFSCSKEAVPEENIGFSITQLGFYTLSGTPVFEVKSTAKSDNFYGFFEKFNPTQGKMAQFSWTGDFTQGQTVSLTVKARDVDGLTSGQLSAQVVKVTDSQVSLKTDRFVVVLPK